MAYVVAENGQHDPPILTSKSQLTNPTKDAETKH